MRARVQRAYLEAMDISVWCLRETASSVTPGLNTAPGLRLGPGGGGILLVCAVDSDSESRLAGDVSRSLGSVPVWAWPTADDDAVQLTDAIDKNLFTTIAIFGKELATQLFNQELPVSLNAAKLVQLPSMQDIQSRADARSALWVEMCRSGMISRD